MKNRILVPLLVMVAMGVWSCSNDTTAPAAGEGAISGTVKDKTSGLALEGVSVAVSGNFASPPSVTTDASGAYTVKFTVDSIATVTITMSRDRYRDTTMTLQVFEGSTTKLNVLMSSIQSVSGGTGTPQMIAFLSAAPPELSVSGVGGKETSVLSWQVRDSLGNPMDAFSPATINLSIVTPLGGGEYISPATIQTDATGSAAVTFNSGTRAGVVEILATVVSGTKTIQSSPVRLVVHGGFPDQAHFTIAAVEFNFPALGIAGMRDQISVIVGDKYSNPSSPSAVYFRTTAGVIQGTVSGAITTQDGQGTVDLISGNPLPMGSNADPVFGNGFHWVVARTLGQNGVAVQDSLLIVWSGGAIIENISPATFSIPNAGSTTINFTVDDINGNPLAAGTSINVVATIPPPPMDGVEQNKVFLIFGDQGRVTLPDTRSKGPGLTQFSMIVQDGSWGIVDAAGTPVNIAITVSGPNAVNPLTATITGVVH